MDEMQLIFDYYRVNEPIFIEDIIKMCSTHSRQWVDHELSVLTASGRLRRFAAGIYYIPSKEKTGTSKIDVNKVIINKYIERADKVFGYVSGDSLLKDLKLIIAEPDEITIVTNKEKTRGRNVMIGNKRIRLINKMEILQK
ncbi:MAG: hypothetical protein IJH07_05775 [Ruminococcus sp.]|nr:hypothetical protein [Ruminococcus sp.]